MMPMFGEHNEMRKERKEAELFKFDSQMIIEEVDN